MDNLTLGEIKVKLAEAESKEKAPTKKKKTATSKKAFIAFMTWCGIVQLITGAAAIYLRSEMLLAIFATEAVLGPVFTYKYYLEYNKEINLKHMEQNYQEDYDQRHGIK